MKNFVPNFVGSPDQILRERKGAFFTPRIWVDLSQKYLADYLGENWQDEYYPVVCGTQNTTILHFELQVISLKLK